MRFVTGDNKRAPSIILKILCKDTGKLGLAKSWEMAVAYSESRTCKHHVLLVAVVGMQGQDAPPLLLLR